MDTQKIFKKSMSIQEGISNALPIPVLAVIIFLNFPFAKNHLILFLVVVAIAAGVSQTVATKVKRRLFCKMLALRENETDSMILAEAKKETFRAISLAIPMPFIRWGVWGSLAIIVPFIVTQTIAMYEIVGVVWLTVSTGIVVIPVYYLIDQEVFSQFFTDRKIAAIPTSIEMGISLRKKVLLSFGVSVFYPVSILLLLITFDILGYTENRNNILSIVLAIFVSLAIGGIVGHLISKSIQETAARLADSVEHFSNGSITAIYALPVTSSDEFGSLVTSFNILSDRLSVRTGELAQIGNGDLSSSVQLYSTEDEIGSGIQKMHQNLVGMIGKIDEIAETLRTGSGAISDASISLSEGTTEQAASLEEITSSVHEIQSLSMDMAERSSNAGALAVKNRTASETSYEKMNSLASDMKQMSLQADTMRNVIKTIEDIAFQTNLLALNAAVEAARAGQHGKGFAVVADEVRNLANRSSDAVHQTESLIESVLSKIESAEKLSFEMRSSLTVTAQIGEEIEAQVQQIQTFSETQQTSISQITTALDEINSVVQNSAASAEELASAANELNYRALQLTEETNRFVLTDEKEVPPTQMRKSIRHS